MASRYVTSNEYGTPVVDLTARVTRDRGRRSVASPQYRTKTNRLEAIAVLSAEMLFLPKVSEVKGRMSPHAMAERTLTGMIRMAARSGATAQEIAGATGQTKSWAKGKMTCVTPGDRGSFKW